MIFSGQHILIKKVINVDGTDIEKAGAVYTIFFPGVCGRWGGVKLCGWD